MQAVIEANRQVMKSNKQDYDEKMMNLTEDFKSMLTAITDHINTFKSLANLERFTKASILYHCGPG